MKTKAKTKRKRPMKEKLKRKPAAKPKIKVPKSRVAARAPKKQPVSGPKSGDSDRGLYVRFENADVKGQVKAAADAANLSMNAYIVEAVLAYSAIAALEDLKKAI